MTKQVVFRCGLFGLTMVGPAYAGAAEQAGQTVAEPATPQKGPEEVPTKALENAPEKVASDKPVPGAEASADKPPTVGDGQPPIEASAVKVERTATGARLFRITEGLVVEGQMQKPAAFYVLRRAAVRYDYAELGQSFLPKIGAVVRARPF